jgi:transposase
LGGEIMLRAEYPTDISREQFEPVREMLETARRRTRPRKHDLYDVLCALLYFLETGVPWRSMPRDFPPWRTVHEYFTQWTIAPYSEASLLERALVLVGRAELAERVRVMRAGR